MKKIFFLFLYDECQVHFISEAMKLLYKDVQIASTYDECDICFIGTACYFFVIEIPFKDISKEKINFLILHESSQYMDVFLNKDFYSDSFFSNVHVIGMQDLYTPALSFLRFSYWKYYIDWFDSNNYSLVKIKNLESNLWKDKQKDDDCSFVSSYTRNTFAHRFPKEKITENILNDKNTQQYLNNNRYEYVSFINNNLCLVNEYGRKISIGSGQKSKINQISKHKIHLAFENTISPKYVTEKLFHGIISGSITLYYGDEYSKKEFNENKFFLFNDQSTLLEQWDKINSIKTSKIKTKEFLNQEMFVIDPDINQFLEYVYSICK
jgi:hypothetical protein